MDGAELMRKVARAFEQSDVQPLLDAIHDEIVWANTRKQCMRASSASTGEYKNRRVLGGGNSLKTSPC